MVAVAGPSVAGPAGGTVWLCLTLSSRPISCYEASRCRELVPCVDLELSHTTCVLDGSAVGVRVVGRRRLQVVLVGLERVFQGHVVQKPGEVLGVALADLDG